jgi:curli biogenesis system outer membrane secretion channel CsgG
MLSALLVAGGCSTFVDHRQAQSRPQYGSGKRFRPVVAIDEFENRSGFRGQWDLGSGMADVLTTELIDSDEFTVLERRQLDSVLGEIVRQGRELFRREGRVSKGRLKNARYLISGAITDFTVTGDSSGWFGYNNTVKARGGGSKARVSLHLRLTDIESGEIMASVAEAGTARSGWFSAAVNYKNVAFGGDTFFQTPLGKATREAIERAVKEISQHIPREYWQPRVAEAGPDTVVLNGGSNVGVRVGDRFVIREKGRDITDPITGDVIEKMPGKVLGRLKVTSVNRMSAYAVIESGTAHRGAFLEATR